MVAYGGTASGTLFVVAPCRMEDLYLLYNDTSEVDTQDTYNRILTHIDRDTQAPVYTQKSTPAV